MINANLCQRYKRPERESGKQLPHDFTNSKMVNLFNAADSRLQARINAE